MEETQYRNEFLLKSDFMSEVNAFASAGNSLNSEGSSIDGSAVSSLKTCAEYIKQHEQIKILIQEYAALAAKDVRDLIVLQQKAKQTDFRLAKSFAKE